MMSSGDAQESFRIGAHVDATDGPCGNLARLIFNPITDVLTHLIVEPGHHDEQARVVPFDLVVSARDDVVQLSCTKERYDQLDSAEASKCSATRPASTTASARHRCISA